MIVRKSHNSAPKTTSVSRNYLFVATKLTQHSVKSNPIVFFGRFPFPTIAFICLSTNRRSEVFKEMDKYIHSPFDTFKTQYRKRNPYQH